jgi:hypothetical protein
MPLMTWCVEGVPGGCFLLTEARPSASARIRIEQVCEPAHCLAGLSSAADPVVRNRADSDPTGRGGRVATGRAHLPAARALSHRDLVPVVDSRRPDFDSLS